MISVSPRRALLALGLGIAIGVKRYYSNPRTMATTLAPAIALSHGGGPLPILNDPGHKDIIYSLKNRVPKILRLGTPQQPKAIVLVTAHWTTDKPVVSSGKTHELLYDYYGFPPESYKLKYPAPGEPDVAARVGEAFAAQGLKPELDPKRPWDHGVFVPLTLVAPEAEIPVVQVSVLLNEDPDRHLRMGAALQALRRDNIAVVGSGFASFHNLGTMRALSMWPLEKRAAFKKDSDEWNDAVTGVVTAATAKDRWDGIKAWRSFPHADTMHPPGGGEHFMPLIVCVGAAEEGEETKFYKDTYTGVDIYTYYWGGEEVK
ncbi:calcium-translocating P-type ATPase, PMCA-type [Purpureocillium lavendulum]|uniref:Calcium-translocating P-type ATPase, PMCA-type n=1 Tax=Purpureocillium lavendulum TaxID=1247861 RepID=A0AB34FS75_9HYPO|nr:calcium-translocating P-type ATPase, PMCA-type [Purpureocillium lavendulum]